MTLTASPANSRLLLYTFKDILKLFRQFQLRILLTACFGALLFACYTLTKPISYTVEASFREKNSSKNSLSSSSAALTALMFTGSIEGSDSSAISIMKSRKMMERLIRAEGLQGEIRREGEGTSYWTLMKQNLTVEYAHWSGSRFPSIVPPEPLLQLADIHYDGEVPANLSIAFYDETHFTVATQNGSILGKGELSLPFSYTDYRFKILKNGEEKLTDQHFAMTLFPMAFTASDLSKQLSISSNPDDKNLLILTMRCSDRKRGVHNLNTLMSLYQQQLREDQERLVGEQLRYLQQRHHEIDGRLQEMMRTFADNLSKEFNLLGFIDTQRAMEFLSHQQHTIKVKQITIDMEIQRLLQARVDGKIYFDALSTHPDGSFFTQLLWQISDLQQQHDSIQVSLNTNDTTSTDALQNGFQRQMERLANLEQTQRDLIELLDQLEGDVSRKELSERLKHSHYMIASWHDKFQSSHGEEQQEVKQRYLHYLQNLLRYLQLQSKSIEEGLVHQQTFSPTLQGINLSIAKELFLAYSKEADELEGKILEHNFLIEQLQQPHFEVSSLSIILDDPVSHDIARQAKTLALAIKDHANRSQKELERLEDELHQQRNFLTMHLRQAKELLKLRLELLHEKLRSVQLTTLSLIQQQISVSQKQLNDYVDFRIDNLKQESLLLIKQAEELQHQMALLPDKWVEEQLIHQQMELNKGMGKDITALVESKNIGSNLEIMQSAPLDLAIAPLHPITPRFLLLSLLGAFGGAITISAWLLIRSALIGMPPSIENLRLAGTTVASEVSFNYFSAWLASLKENKNVRTLCIAHGSHPSYASALTGILNGQGYQAISFTGQTPISPSLLRSFLQKQSENYDWVIVAYPLPADHPSLLMTVDLFDAMIIHVGEKPLPLLYELIQKVADHHALFALGIPEPISTQENIIASLPYPQLCTS